MSMRGSLGFGVVAATLLMNCGGRAEPAGDGSNLDPGTGATGGAGGAGDGNTGGGGGIGGSGETGGSGGTQGDAGSSATGGGGGAGVGGSTSGTGGVGGSTGGGGGVGGSTAGTDGGAGKGGARSEDGGTGNTFIDLLPGLNLSQLCTSCVSSQCGVAVASCSFVESCVASTSCAFTSCNGFADEACALKCFNGDSAQMSMALTAMKCVYQKCTAECIDPVAIDPKARLDRL